MTVQAAHYLQVQRSADGCLSVNDIVHERKS